MEILKKIGNGILFVLLFIWQLPQNLVALVMLPFLGKLKKIEYRNFCYAFEAERMSGGISLGNFIFLSPYCAKRETTVAHEFGHVVDSQRMGIMYLFIIGIPSILWATFHGSACYYDFFTESRANKNAGLGVDSMCRLYFLDKPDYKKKNK